MSSKRLVSGIRPTGILHVGNYIGAMKNLLELKQGYDCFYFISDLHSLTTHPQPETRGDSVIQVAKMYLAAGLDPKQCTLYTQSAIAAEVSELHLYLSMVMPLGELMRCPTFKEKAKKHPDNVNYGLAGYPVLMAADVLALKGELVPVGEDQLVHLEIARSIVRKFEHLYGELFPKPQPLAESAVRIPSLNGKGKMSKSDGEKTLVMLNDSTEQIRKKSEKSSI